jgi:hypothetical protein
MAISQVGLESRCGVGIALSELSFAGTIPGITATVDRGTWLERRVERVAEDFEAGFERHDDLVLFG